MRNPFLTVFLGTAVSLFVGFERSASAQPDAAMMQAIQSNLDSQRAIAAHQQATWHNQNVQATVRQHEENASRSGVNQGGGFNNFQAAPTIQWGAGGNPFMPMGRLQPWEMMGALQELNGVDLRNLDSMQRAQCKAAARKLRLSLQYSYSTP
jgi:hypothetical protein